MDLSNKGLIYVIHIHLYIYIYMCVCTYIYIYIYIYKHVCMYMRMSVYEYMSTFCVCIYIYTCVCMGGAGGRWAITILVFGTTEKDHFFDSLSQKHATKHKILPVSVFLPFDSPLLDPKPQTLNPGFMSQGLSGETPKRDPQSHYRIAFRG